MFLVICVIGMYHLKLPERLNQILVTRSANASLVGAEVLQGAAGPMCRQISKWLGECMGEGFL